MEKVPEVIELRTVNESSSEILSIKFSPDDSMIALACSNGRIKLYSSETYRIISLLEHSSSKQMPITSICWRPSSAEDGFEAVLLSSSVDGWITHWSINPVNIVNTFRILNAQCLAVDYAPDRKAFAVGCSDYTIKLCEGGTLLRNLDFGKGEKPGHSNRIFAVKWKNPDILISGGWDNTIIIWDIRNYEAILTCYGPHICGNAIDCTKSLIFAGSYSRNEQIQVFDLKKGRKIKHKTLRSDEKPVVVFSLQFNKAGPQEFFCTTGTQISIRWKKTLDSLFVSELPSESFCCDWAHSENKLVVGNSAGFFKVFYINQV